MWRDLPSNPPHFSLFFVLAFHRNTSIVEWLCFININLTPLDTFSSVSAGGEVKGGVFGISNMQNLSKLPPTPIKSFWYRVGCHIFTDSCHIFIFLSHPRCFLPYFRWFLSRSLKVFSISIFSWWLCREIRSKEAREGAGNFDHKHHADLGDNNHLVWAHGGSKW